MKEATPAPFERLEQGLTYEAFLSAFAARAAQVQAPGFEPEDEVEALRAGFIPLNLQRTRRIGKTYTVGPELLRQLDALREPQTWMVLTENWCGDSAQSLPYLAQIADASALITLRILARDENLDLMDRYLTGGARSIPKLVAFDARGRELFRWGPRPRPAVELMEREKAAGTPKEEILPQLHKWYAQDRGRTLEAELLALLRRAAQASG